MTTTLRNIPQLPRPVDFIDKEGKFSLVGYSYLNELEKSLVDVRSLSSTVETSVAEAAAAAAANAEAIAELSDTVSALPRSGILLQRTAVAYYGSLSSIESAGDPVNNIARARITPTALANQIWVHGSVTHSRGSSGGDSAGFIVGVEMEPSKTVVGITSDWNAGDVQSTPFSAYATAETWMGFSGVSVEVGSELIFDLWAVDNGVSYRVNRNSFIYAEEIAA